MSTDQFKRLPDGLQHRAEQLHSVGLSPAKAVALGVECFYHTTDWDSEDIAAVLDVDPKTIASNRSKAKDDVNDALRQVVMAYGGRRVILATKENMYREGATFIVAEVAPSDDYEAARDGETSIGLITVTAGGPSGEPSIYLNVDTERYDSLDELADETYRDDDGAMDSEQLRRWYDALIEAGVDPDTLEEPGKKLPPSHPDSADHFQYQMQSLEPEGVNRPPRPDEQRR